MKHNKSKLRWSKKWKAQWSKKSELRSRNVGAGGGHGIS